MTETDIQQLFLRKLRLRIEPEMAKYVLRQTQRGSASPSAPMVQIPVMGADARTGIPLRQNIDSALFQNE